jgi:hypothetical protein
MGCFPTMLVEDDLEIFCFHLISGGGMGVSAAKIAF